VRKAKGLVSALLSGLMILYTAVPVWGELEAKIPKDAVESSGPRPAQYYFSLGTQDELLMKVNIWGQVLKPGQYLVPDNTDIVSLISFAGGPTENARINRIKVVRTMGGKREVITINLKNYLESADPESVLLLKPGDTIVISGSIFHMFARFAGFVSQLAIIANVYYLFFLRD